MGMHSMNRLGGNLRGIKGTTLPDFPINFYQARRSSDQRPMASVVHRYYKSPIVLKPNLRRRMNMADRKGNQMDYQTMGVVEIHVKARRPSLVNLNENLGLNTVSK